LIVQLLTPVMKLKWHEVVEMQGFSFYITLNKQSPGLSVRKGSSLPDLADTSDVPGLHKALGANGHALQELGAWLPTLYKPERLAFQGKGGNHAGSTGRLE
jgi:hypothetical protein